MTVKPHTKWRKGPLPYCECCKAGGDLVETVALPGRHPGVAVVCHVCGWEATRTPDDPPPRPAGMADDEYAFRSKLYETWRDRPAAEYVGQLKYFADWLGDQGRTAEETVARWNWHPFRNKQPDAAGWWQWSCRPVASGFAGFGKRFYLGLHERGLRKQHHTAAWFLGWPPGSVRLMWPSESMTGPKIVVTVVPGRSLRYSSPVEFKIPGGLVGAFVPPPKEPSLF